jgi:hypothetical protein
MRKINDLQPLRRRGTAISGATAAPALLAALLLLAAPGCSDDDENGATFERLGGANAAIHALGAFEGAVFFGGDFGRVDAFGDDVEVNHLAGYAPARGAAAPDFVGADVVEDAAGTWYDVDPEPNGGVHALLEFRGELVAAGAFTYVGTEVQAGRVAAWDGTTWRALGNGFDGTVYALAALGDSLLFAAGAFTTADGAPALRVAQWDGVRWTALGGGVDGPVFALHVQGGSLFAGGNFNAAGGAPANHVARWNGSAWRPLDSGVDGRVRTFATYRGALVAGGDFTMVNGFRMNRVARWNGVSWQPLGEGIPEGMAGVAALLADGDRLLAAVGGDELAGDDGGGPDGTGLAGGLLEWDREGWRDLIQPGAYAGKGLLGVGGRLYLVDRWLGGSAIRLRH